MFSSMRSAVEPSPRRAIAVLKPRRVLVLGYFALVGAASLLIVRQVGILEAALAGLSLLALTTLPGAALVKRFLRAPSVFHYVIVGTVLGLGLLALGGLLSYVTGMHAPRWLPSILATLLWIRRRRGGLNGTRAHVDFPALGVAGAIVSFVALVPSLWAVLKAQPTTWDGWHKFHVDLTFQMALVGETSLRVPEEFPWVGEPLSYPWLFHAATGVWASAIGMPAADLILQVWPVLYASLMPAMIAIVGWHLTRQKCVALVAPMVFVLTHGLIFASGLTQEFPLFQVSPTRDFAHLFVLLTLLAANEALRGRVVRWWWLAPLCIGGMVASGAKSSSLPVLAGGILATVAMLIVVRRFSYAHLATVVAVSGASMIGFVLVLPVRGLNDAVVIEPLSFLSPDVPNRFELSLVVVLTVGVAIVGAWFIVCRGWRIAWTSGSLLAGVCLAGLAGVAILGHPGMSQLYFWQAAQPAFSILVSWAGLAVVKVHAWRGVVALTWMFFIGHVLSTISKKPWLLFWAMFLCSTAVAVVIFRDKLRGNRGQRTGLAAVVSLAATIAFLPQAAQIIRVPTGFVGSGPASALDQAAVHSSQLAAFGYLRNETEPEARIISNVHCRQGDVATGSCDSRWFSVSGFSERRVWVEGWAYTPRGFEVDWIADRLQRNDDFIATPSRSEAQALRDIGISYVYIDKRGSYSADLDGVASLVYDGEWASVYELKDQ